MLQTHKLSVSGLGRGWYLLTSGKDGKKKFAMGLPFLDCLAKALGRNVTPSGLYCLPLKLSCDKSAGLVKASNTTLLSVNCFSDKDSLFPNVLR